MGKGDKKTRRGKTYAGSYGNVRKHKAGGTVATTAATSKATRAAPVRKATTTRKKSA